MSLFFSMMELKQHYNREAQSTKKWLLLTEVYRNLIPLVSLKITYQSIEEEKVTLNYKSQPLQFIRLTPPILKVDSV
jgi:hypothetical protein